MSNILDTEQSFMIEVNNIISNNWVILKSDYKFCYVDFLLINRNNLFTLYTEYKKREYICNKSVYSSFFVSKKKLEMIKKYYKKCILIWDFRSKDNPDDFFYIHYDKSFLDKYECEYDRKNCSYRYKILKEDCLIGFNNYVKIMNDITNLNLDK